MQITNSENAKYFFYRKVRNLLIDGVYCVTVTILEG